MSSVSPSDMHSPIGLGRGHAVDLYVQLRIWRGASPPQAHLSTRSAPVGQGDPEPTPAFDTPMLPRTAQASLPVPTFHRLEDRWGGVNERHISW